MKTDMELLRYLWVLAQNGHHPSVYCAYVPAPIFYAKVRPIPWSTDPTAGMTLEQYASHLEETIPYAEAYWAQHDRLVEDGWLILVGDPLITDERREYRFSRKTYEFFRKKP